MKAAFNRAMGRRAEEEFLQEHPDVAERRREANRLRAEQQREQREELIAAGRIYAPRGGWDQDAADALAAVFSSEALWEFVNPDQREGAVFEPDDTLTLFWALSLLAENQGKPVRWQAGSGRTPRGRMLRAYSDDRLRHLARNGWLTLEVNGNLRTISRGPRVEELRKAFALQFEERAKEKSAADGKARKRQKGTTPS